MGAGISDQLTDNFYQWEIRGRGWSAYDFPVDLEPPFRPFTYSCTPTRIDDGIVTPWWKQIGAALFPKKPKKKIYTRSEDEPYKASEDIPLRAIIFHFSKNFTCDSKDVEQVLLMLSTTQFPISFEIIGETDHIRVQMVCRDTDCHYVMGQLQIFFPGITFIDTEEIPPILIDQQDTYMQDYGLHEEFMRPLNRPRSLNNDPLTGLIGVLNSLRYGERGGIQILFQGAGNPWSQHIVRSVLTPGGEPFFADAPEMVPLVKDKIASPLCAVSIRVFAQGHTVKNAFSICETLGNALQQGSRSPHNSLISLQGPYEFQTRAEDIILRQSHRLGMLLSIQELITFVHPPSPSLNISKIVGVDRKSRPTPTMLQRHEFVVGHNLHGGQAVPVSIPEHLRMQHMHVIGATGTGKSNLLINSVIQDMHHGDGVCVLDPHGDLIDTLLSWIPEHRKHDVILVDPSDTEYTVGLNLLSAHSESEKQLIASDLVSSFRRLSTSWGDQMNSVFSNAVLAFLESSTGGTLYDLKRFLVEKPFREQFLMTVADEHCQYYWKKEFPLLKTNSIGPILTRLDTFLRPKPIRNMVTQQKGLDMNRVLDSGKILLVKLSQGLIGEENSFLLGSLFVSKVHQAALARQAIAKEERKPFYLYIDEFHNFVTPSMSGLLTGVRKYHLGLILAHQGMHQIEKIDTDVAEALLANAATRVCFRLNEHDAHLFEKGFATFDALDIQSQGTGEALIRVQQPTIDCSISITQVPHVGPVEAKLLHEEIAQLSRERYGSKIQQEVQQIIVPDAIVESLLIPIVEVAEELPIAKAQPKEITELSEDKVEVYKAKETKRKAESEHRYLQTLIKKMAEARGYKALIEEPTPDGQGRVDVLLEKDKKRIACEISCTTTDEWEVHNLQKCLNAGYETIIVCSKSKQQLQKIRTASAGLVENKNVHFFMPEELFVWLDKDVVVAQPQEQKIKGYRIKVNYNNSHSQTINKAVSKTLLNKKPKKS